MIDEMISLVICIPVIGVFLVDVVLYYVSYFQHKTELSKNTLDMLIGKVLKHTQIGNEKISCVQVK